MTLDIVFSPLALEPKTFNVGDAIRVTASFIYLVGADTSVEVQAGPYQYKLGILDRIGSCFGITTVSLPKTTTPTEKQFTIDFTLKATDGIAAGTYGLLVEIPGTDFSVKQDDVLIVGAVPNIFSQILPIIIMVMLMGMVTSMTEEEKPEGPVAPVVPVAPAPIGPEGLERPVAPMVSAERSGVIVTVTDKGDTSWDVGDSIVAEEFDIENKRIEAQGKRHALGEYHY